MAWRVKLAQRLVDAVPVVPGQLVVLAVRVVVALLRPAQLVAPQQHGHPLGEQQGSQDVALLARAQGVDGAVVGGPLHAAVPGPVVALPVAAVLAVGLVVLVVEGDQIA
jgi:hypothetical protein